ncbi:hypothetical protein F5B18DRAFT_637408 [Nemania serpens]|nr:hypothetical protein F5B18DRAFT_637408 [Nemania serpens]
MYSTTCILLHVCQSTTCVMTGRDEACHQRPFSPPLLPTRAPSCLSSFGKPTIGASPQPRRATMRAKAAVPRSQFDGTDSAVLHTRCRCSPEAVRVGVPGPAGTENGPWRWTGIHGSYIRDRLAITPTSLPKLYPRGVRLEPILHATISPPPPSSVIRRSFLHS